MENIQTLQKVYKYHYTKKPGRPKLTDTILTNDLPENWKELVLRYFSQGYSEVGVMAEICKTNMSRWEKLIERSSEFRAVYLLGKKLCEAWWEKQGLTCLKKNNFQGFVWFQNMKNRFGWKERQDIMHDLSENLVEKLSQVSSLELQRRGEELLARSRIPVNTN